MHKKMRFTALGAIILASGISVWGLAISRPTGPEENDQTQSSNSEANKVVPTCKELNPTQEQIDAAVSTAIIGIHNPWGNVSDFKLLLDRVEAKLGCTLQKSNDITKEKYTK